MYSYALKSASTASATASTASATASTVPMTKRYASKPPDSDSEPQHGLALSRVGQYANLDIFVNVCNRCRNVCFFENG